MQTEALFAKLVQLTFSAIMSRKVIYLAPTRYISLDVLASTGDTPSSVNGVLPSTAGGVASGDVFHLRRLFCRTTLIRIGMRRARLPDAPKTITGRVHLSLGQMTLIIVPSIERAMQLG